MPIEIGLVVEMRGAKALVRTSRKEACEGCTSGGYCNSAGGKDLLIEADNAAGAAPGETVTVKIPDTGIAGSSFLIYTLPVVFLIAGLALGELAADFAGWSTYLTGMITGLVFLIVSLAGVLLLRKRAAARAPAASPSIISIRTSTDDPGY